MHAGALGCQGWEWEGMMDRMIRLFSPLYAMMCLPVSWALELLASRHALCSAAPLRPALPSIFCSCCVRVYARLEGTHEDAERPCRCRPSPLLSAAAVLMLACLHWALDTGSGPADRSASMPINGRRCSAVRSSITPRGACTVATSCESSLEHHWVIEVYQLHYMI